MPKLHLLMKKEDIDEDKLNQDKIAVIFDVLVATSTITAALYYGAKEVIPVLNEEDAKKEAKGREKASFVLVGEYEGRTIEGFLDPNPLRLKEVINGKTMILSTTNGTVAVRKATRAKKVYICSILNGQSVADTMKVGHKNETIILICSGSSGQFCIEDFYGAGYFLDCLMGDANQNWELTDAAQAALLFYRGTPSGVEVLRSSRVGQMLLNYGFRDDIDHVAQRGIMPISPYLKDKKVIVKGEK